MPNPVLSELLVQVTDLVERGGLLLSAEWSRPGGPHGHGDKADVDAEIERILRHELLSLFACDFWSEETGYALTGHAWCWVVCASDSRRHS